MVRSITSVSKLTRIWSWADRTWLIMKVLWKVLGGGSADDVREEDDEKED